VIDRRWKIRPAQPNKFYEQKILCSEISKRRRAGRGGGNRLAVFFYELMATMSRPSRFFFQGREKELLGFSSLLPQTGQAPGHITIPVHARFHQPLSLAYRGQRLWMPPRRFLLWFLVRIEKKKKATDTLYPFGPFRREYSEWPIFETHARLPANQRGECQYVGYCF